MAGKKRSYAVEMVIRGKDLVSSVMGKVGRSLTSLARLSGRVFSGIGGFLEKIPGLSILGGGIASAVGGLKDLVTELGDVSGNLTDLTQRTGLSTRQLQEMAFAAQKVGIPVDELNASFLRMTGVIGKGVGASQLRVLGKDASGFARALKAAKGPAEKFEVVLSQMAKITDTNKRAAFAMTFFGKAGVKLAAVATDGADGIKAMRLEAQRLGLVLSDEEIARADKMSDTMESLGMVAKGVKRDFGSGLIEAFLPELEDLLKYVRENRVAVRDLVREWGKKIGTGIVDAAHALVGAVKWIVDNKDTIIGVVGKIASVIVGLKALELTRGIFGSLGGVGGAVAGAAGAAGAGAGTSAVGGAVGVAARVLGPAAAAIFLDPNADEESGLRSQSHRRSSINDLRAKYKLGAPVDFGAMDKSYESVARGLPDSLSSSARNSILNGFTSINKVFEDAITQQARDARASDITTGFRSMFAGALGSFVAPPPKEEKVEVVVRLEGVTDGAEVTQVKATSGVRAKVTGGVGARTTSHLKGGR